LGSLIHFDEMKSYLYFRKTDECAGMHGKAKPVTELKRMFVPWNR